MHSNGNTNYVTIFFFFSPFLYTAFYYSTLLCLCVHDCYIYSCQKSSCPGPFISYRHIHTTHIFVASIRKKCSIYIHRIFIMIVIRDYPYTRCCYFFFFFFVCMFFFFSTIIVFRRERDREFLSCYTFCIFFFFFYNHFALFFFLSLFFLLRHPCH